MVLYESLPRLLEEIDTVVADDTLVDPTSATSTWRVNPNPEQGEHLGVWVWPVEDVDTELWSGSDGRLLREALLRVRLWYELVRGEVTRANDTQRQAQFDAMDHATRLCNKITGAPTIIASRAQSGTSKPRIEYDIVDGYIQVDSFLRFAYIEVVRGAV